LVQFRWSHLLLLALLIASIPLGSFFASADEAAPAEGVVLFISGQLATEAAAPVEAEAVADAAEESALAIEEAEEGEAGAGEEEPQPPAEAAAEDAETAGQELGGSELPAEEGAAEPSVEAGEVEAPREPVAEQGPAPEQQVAAGLEVLAPWAEVPPEPAKAPKEVGRFFGPLPTRNRHPVHGMFFNFPAERARTLPPGAREFAFRFDAASTMVKENRDGTIVDLDLESWHYQLEYRQGFASGELTILLPWGHNTHGFMDNIIDSWHGFFGLPRGNRPDYPENDYHFFVRNAGGSALNLLSDRFAAEDLSLAWKGELGRDSPESALSYRLGVKLPTGDSDYGLGSGGTDFGVGLAYEELGTRWAGYFNLNYIFIGAPSFEGFSYNDIVSGCAAVEYRLRPTWWLTAQVNLSQYPLTTGTAILDRDAVELLFGFHKLLRRRLLFSGGFSEDIRTDTGPDFGLTGELKWLF